MYSPLVAEVVLLIEEQKELAAPMQLPSRSCIDFQQAQMPLSARASLIAGGV